ncbi:unnamed protein product [Heligmosomoides polygyrus]|uniref:Transposase n=1 Tax=Heligmosomoides polygyrus TaxID=6339 RepID=A0A183FY01_HELPZ|nr:unnamed protein product [Heligmosomoides polygyrus]
MPVRGRLLTIEEQAQIRSLKDAGLTNAIACHDKRELVSSDVRMDVSTTSFEIPMVIGLHLYRVVRV